MHKSSIRTVHSRRGSPILVCKKCVKRFEGGPKLKRALKREVKRLSRKGPKARLISTSCLGICPKRAIVVTGPDGLQKREYLLVDRVDGIPAAAAAVLTRYPLSGRET